MQTKKQFLAKWLRHYFKPGFSNNHRAKLLHPESILALGLFIFSFLLFLNGLKSLNILDKVLGFASNITPEEIVLETNEIRLKSNLKPLVVNPDLSRAALAKGQNMFSEQYWAHIAPDGKEPWDFMKEANYKYIVAGENLARDFAVTDDMVQAWMQSPTHRANLVNPKYDEIGIAVIDGELFGNETTLVVQMFGTRGVASVADQGVVSGDSSEKTLATSLPGLIGPGLSQSLVVNDNLRASPIFSPLQVIKAVILIVILAITFTLVYDLAIIGNYQTMRIVGKNMAHIALFLVVAFLLIFFKAGVVG